MGQNRMKNYGALIGQNIVKSKMSEAWPSRKHQQKHLSRTSVEEHKKKHSVEEINPLIR
jgi:hypothetical protein